MTRGRFQAVVTGTWETDSSVPVLVIGMVCAAAIVGWLLTVLLALALAAAAVTVTAGAACWLLLRRNDRDAELLAERSAALHTEVTARTAPPSVTVNHYHLHLAPGATAEGTSWAAPQPDPITKGDHQ